MNKILIFLCLFLAISFADNTCQDGIPVKLGNKYAGNTTNSNSTSIECQIYKYSPRGIWYSYNGEGKPVVFDTCDEHTDFATVIFVYDSCGEFGGYINSCLTFNDVGCGESQSRVQFFAELNKQYFIFVAGVRKATGAFSLSVSEANPPSNYQCQNAVDVSQFPFSVTDHTDICLPVNDGCQQNTQSAGLWYKIAANSGSYVAHTCNLNTDFDTVISVFGECSESGVADKCIATNNDACDRSSVVFWNSIQNSFFWVFVSGYNNARGRFTLAIEQRSMNPNSHCYQPIEITSLPFSYTLTTDYVETTFSECRNEDRQHSVFFHYRGEPGRIIATTCTSSSTVNDSVIDIYTDCQSQDSSEHPGSGKQCIASNDDYCGLGSMVDFVSNTDSFFIAVSSVSPVIEGTTFTLEVVSYDNTKNSKCWFAKDIEKTHGILTGDTTEMDASDQTCDGSKFQRRGAWYHYVHSGDKKTMIASTCNENNKLEATIEVFASCDDISCIGEGSPQDGCTTVKFVVQDGLTYNLFITSFNPNVTIGGYYEVDFYEETPTSSHSNSNSSSKSGSIVSGTSSGRHPISLSVTSDPGWNSLYTIIIAIGSLLAISLVIGLVLYIMWYKKIGLFKPSASSYSTIVDPLNPI